MNEKLIKLCDLSEKDIDTVFEEKQSERNILNKLIEVGKKYNIKNIIQLRTQDISIAHWVRLKCKYGCSKYGTSWCCPPETPTPERTKAILSEYDNALLLFGTVKNNHFYRNNNQKRRIQVSTWKGTVALERLLFLEGYYKAFSLVSDTCALCKECSYPDPCKFPQERRPSIESCAIDIFQTLFNIGKSFDIADKVSDEYQCFSIILLE